MKFRLDTVLFGGRVYFYKIYFYKKVRLKIKSIKLMKNSISPAIGEIDKVYRYTLLCCCEILSCLLIINENIDIKSIMYVYRFFNIAKI